MEAARWNSGLCEDAVGEMGSSPTGFPALVARRREHWVSGGATRGESCSLVQDIKPARQIVDDLVREAKAVIEQMKRM